MVPFENDFSAFSVSLLKRPLLIFTIIYERFSSIPGLPEIIIVGQKQFWHFCEIFALFCTFSSEHACLGKQKRIFAKKEIFDIFSVKTVITEEKGNKDTKSSKKYLRVNYSQPVKQNQK